MTSLANIIITADSDRDRQLAVVRVKWIWSEIYFEGSGAQNAILFLEDWWLRLVSFAQPVRLKVTNGVTSHQARRLSMGGTKMSGQSHCSQLLKWIFPSCQRVKSEFLLTPADSGHPFSIGSVSPVASSPTVCIASSLSLSNTPPPWLNLNFSPSRTHSFAVTRHLTSHWDLLIVHRVAAEKLYN